MLDWHDAQDRPIRVLFPSTGNSAGTEPAGCIHPLAERGDRQPGGIT